MARQQAEQQDIEGTRVLNRRVEPTAKTYAATLSERMDAQAREGKLREKLIELMSEEQLDSYILKSGETIRLVEKGLRIKVESPKDEDAKAERAERRQVKLIED